MGDRIETLIIKYSQGKANRDERDELLDLVLKDINKFLVDLSEMKKIAIGLRFNELYRRYQFNFETVPTECPQCKSREIVTCKGGTCYKPNPKINWLCKTCLNEW